MKELMRMRGNKIGMTPTLLMKQKPWKSIKIGMQNVMSYINFDINGKIHRV